MEIRVLGDLTIDGGRLSPKELSLLAVLALRSGNIVTPSELADAVWGDDLPATWPKQVQAAIVHIRRALGTASVATTRGGYRLLIDPDQIDAARFEHLLQLAREHLVDGDPARAVDTIERALSLWTGEPYSDIREWPPAVTEAERLLELRAVAEEDLQRSRLACGEHRGVVADAERLVRTEPLREPRWVILATALYRCGRQADALAAIRRARGLLDEELGIEPGTDLVALETAILRQDAGLEAPPAPPHTSEECPYPGLQAFGTDDEDTFFGRDDDIAAAVARISRAPFLAISGTSGCGKSSLVLAGVVPALRAHGDTVAVLPTGAASVTRLRDALAERTHADVVVIDQFEELFHSGLSEQEVAEFCAVIADAVGSGRRVIVAVRSDFLDDCAGEPSIGHLFTEGVHFVGPLTPEGLRRAIEEPAKLAGLRLEPGLTGLILRDAAGSPSALPHVSHALVETWLRREGATLTVAGYEESGGISGAIAQSADELFLSLDPTQREICRSTFMRLVEIDSDGTPMRRRVPLKPLRADAAHDLVITGLARARLVSAEEDSLIVAHESLATAWPRLRGWLDADAEGTRTMHALQTAASTWEADERPDDDLYRGARLQAAIEWQDAAAPELTESEQEFLAASAAHEQAAVDEITRRAQHDRRQNRKLRVMLAASVALFAVAATAGGLVAVGANETAKQRAEAQIGDLTSTSLALRSTGRDVAALLAVEAHRRWPDDARTRSALMGAMQSAGGLLSTAYPVDVREMAGRMIPGTRHAVVATDSKVAVYDVDSGEVVRKLDIPRGDIFVDTHLGPAISADGGRVAVGEHTWPPEHHQRNGAVLFIADVATGARIQGPIEFDTPLSSLVISPDGATVATIDALGALYLVNAETGDVRPVAAGADHELQLNTDRAGALAFTPSGSLVYGTMSGEVLLIDPVGGAVVGSMRPPDGSTNVSIAVVSDSVAVVTGDLRISAVDPAQQVALWSRDLNRQSLEPYPWIAVSEARGTVYGGDLWGRIEERSLGTGELTGRSFEPQLGNVGPMHVSSDGLRLDVVGRSTAAFTSWRLDGTSPISRLVAPGSVIGDRYSSDGSLVFTGRAPADPTRPIDGYAVIDTRTGDVVFRPPDDWYDMGWTGELLIGLNGGGELGLMSPRTGEQWPLDFPDLNFLEGSSDGQKLYAGTDDGSGEIVTLDAATGKRSGPTFTLGEFTQSVSTNSDGSRVLITATDTDAQVMTSLYDGSTGELLKTTGPEVWGGVGTMGPITRLTDRGEIISLSETRLTRFDATTFEPIGALAGTSGGFAYIGVSADGRTLSAFAQNGTVSLYDLVDGIRLGDPIPAAYPDRLSGFLRPDGMELAVNADDGIAMWDLDPEAHAQAACRIAGRDLTRDEWNTYLADVGEYRSTCGFADQHG